MKSRKIKNHQAPKFFTRIFHDFIRNESMVNVNR